MAARKPGVWNPTRGEFEQIQSGDTLDLTTSVLPEGTNQYYTDARARAAVSATPFKPLTYNPTTGIFDLPQANTAVSGYISNTDWNTFNSKEPSLGSSTANYYLKGDRTWSFFKTDVLGTDLAGLSNLLVGDLSISDSVLTAFGKVRGNINNIPLKDYDWSGKHCFQKGIETKHGDLNTFQNYLDNTKSFTGWSNNYGVTTILSTTELDPFGQNRAIRLSMASACSFLRDVTSQVPNSTSVTMSFWAKKISGAGNGLEVLIKGSYDVVYFDSTWKKYSFTTTSGTAYYLAIQGYDIVFDLYGLQIEDSGNLSPYIYTDSRLADRFEGISIDTARIENKIIFGDNSQLYSESGVLKYKQPNGTVKTVTVT